MTDKYIVLDRDGVINEDLWGYVTTPSEFKFIKGSLEAIKKLNTNGFKIAIATNQACINKGIVSVEELEFVHKFMKEEIRIAGGDIKYIAYCPHDYTKENCKCRKPETGLLTQIENALNINLKDSYFVGDKESDMACAVNYGCRALLVKTGYGQISLESKALPNVEGSFDNLLNAVEYIITNKE